MGGGSLPLQERQGEQLKTQSPTLKVVRTGRNPAKGRQTVANLISEGEHLATHSYSCITSYPWLQASERLQPLVPSRQSFEMKPLVSQRQQAFMVAPSITTAKHHSKSGQGRLDPC